MPRCGGCGLNFDRSQLVRQRVLKGHNGRRKNGYLLMCPSCAKATSDNNAIVAVVTIIIMGILVIVFEVLDKG